MRRVFERISAKAIKTLGLSTSSQRLDSTLVLSNIRLAGLLELFRTTMRLFLDSLSEAHFSRVPEAIRGWHEAAHDGWFGLGMNAKQRRDKLSELLPFAHDLIVLFAGDETITESEAYQLLARLFDEHCRVESDDGTDGDNAPPVHRVKRAKRANCRNALCLYTSVERPCSRPTIQTPSTGIKALDTRHTSRKPAAMRASPK